MNMTTKKINNYCVMCKTSTGSIEFIDTYPTEDTAANECEALNAHHRFLIEAGMQLKPRTYYVERETQGRQRARTGKA